MAEPGNNTEQPSPARAWLPWVLALCLWCLASALIASSIRRWQERERDVLEEQAEAVVQSLGSSLRAMSGRVQRTEGMLERILGEIVEHSTVAGIALVASDGQCVAQVGMPETWMAAGELGAKGVRYLPDTVVVWETVNVGGYRPGQMGGGWGQRNPSEHIRDNTMVLSVSMPLDKLHGRWQRDRAVGIFLSILAFGVLAGGAVAWAQARRSAAYSARLRSAEEHARTLAEVNVVAAGLAHEIKNPLGVVRGTAQRLAGQLGREGETGEAFDVILGEIDRTTSRVNELLSFAKPTDPVATPVPLRRMLTDLERLMQEELTDADLALEFGAISPETRVLADPELLRRVLFNLLHNAIQYAPRSGKVEIGLAMDRKRGATLTVRDHGTGVPEDMRERVFSPYFTTRAEGTGLGLAIVNRIVAAHGWYIACRSADSGGALFEIGGIALAE